MRTLKQSILCLLAFIITLASPFSWAQDNTTATAINKIILFGDSLSDTGNDYQFSYLFRPIIKSIPAFKKEFPTGLIPSPYGQPYFNGRFSDGKNWFEDFANLFHISDTELHHYGALENFSYGGAWASTYTNHGKKAITIFPPDLNEQFMQFELLHPLPYFKHNHVLAILFTGANDYLATDMQTPLATQVSHTIDAIKTAIIRLHDFHHVSHFLIMGMPDLSQTPYATHLNNQQRQLLKKLSLLHNLRLSQLAKTLNDSHAQKQPYHITFINWLSDHQALNQHYKQYHFKFSQHQPCHDFFPYQVPMHIPLSPLLFFTQLMHHNLPPTNQWLVSTATSLPNSIPQQLKNPSQCTDQQASGVHVYMDDVHPTRLAQCMIALRACEKIQTAYTWLDNQGHAHPLNCGIQSNRPDGLQQAADQCYAALQAGDLRQNTLLPFES